jgi:hypothetical protein
MSLLVPITTIKRPRGFSPCNLCRVPHPPGSPRTGHRLWGGDPSHLGTWESIPPKPAPAIFAGCPILRGPDEQVFVRGVEIPRIWGPGIRCFPARPACTASSSRRERKILRRSGFHLVAEKPKRKARSVRARLQSCRKRPTKETGLYRLRKNSMAPTVLKGHGFIRANRPHKMSRGFNP